MNPDDVPVPVPIVLDGLPEAAFWALVGYLDDALRECQLVLVSQSQGHRTDADLGRVAVGLVPAIEEIGDAFRAAEATSDGAGSLRLSGTMTVGQTVAIADLQVQLVHLRILERRGDLLLDDDPETAALLTWICEEVSDQLHGRPARPYRPAG